MYFIYRAQITSTFLRLTILPYSLAALTGVRNAKFSTRPKNLIPAINKKTDALEASLVPSPNEMDTKLCPKVINILSLPVYKRNLRSSLSFWATLWFYKNSTLRSAFVTILNAYRKRDACLFCVIVFVAGRFRTWFGFFNFFAASTAFTMVSAIAICFILVLLVVFILLIVFVGQSITNNPK